MKTSDLIGPALDWAVAKCEDATIGRVYGKGAVCEKQGLWMNERPYVLHSQWMKWYKDCDHEDAFVRGTSIWRPSYDWSQGGPIIARERISTWPDPSWYGGRNATPEWLACKNIVVEEGQYWSTLTGSDPDTITGDHIQGGNTPLIAAMRCYVASKLGDEVDIPKELM